MVDTFGKNPLSVRSCYSTLPILYLSCCIQLFNYVNIVKSQTLCTIRWDSVTTRNNVYKNMNPMVAYQGALTTWSKWVDLNLDANQTKVIFRGMSPRHNKENGWKCYNQKFPLAVVKHPHEIEQLEIVKRTLRKMRFPVYLQDITMLSAYRRDGHPSVYGRRFVNKKGTRVYASDCSHWCLPGVPDTWNEMLSTMI